MNRSGGDFCRFCVLRAALAADGHRDRVWARVQEEGNTRHQLHYLSTTKPDKLRDEERAKSTEGGFVAFAQKQEKPWKRLWRYH